MIRYYVRIELISPAHRSDSDYRLYADIDDHLLIFIRSARNSGFPLIELKNF